MLEQVLTYLRNWFQVGIYPGTYTIRDGGITLPFLQDGQYFRVFGSVFNNGLHQYGPAMKLLRDETFCGTIWALAVPEEVIGLAGEIAEWQEKYQKVAESPYTSESFNNYSYSKGGRSGDGGMNAVSWQSVFRSRLSRYRKLREM